MSLKKIYLNFIIAGIFFFSITLSKAQTQPAYQTKSINGNTNNRLEVLDWGGKGKPILFLTGLGNSAHVFADFAPKFTNKFHVYGMSRRGYGASEQPVNGYGIDTLAGDILAVTNALHIDKVILIGHSIAGDEITKFASSYPDRVDKVIYLDAAYDHTYVPTLFSHGPAFPNLTVQDSSSFLNFKGFVAGIMGISMPDEELKNTTVFSSDGKYQKDVTPRSIQGLIIKGIEQPDYKDMSCSALAIYAIPSSVNLLFPFYSTLDAENKKRADTSFTLFSNFAKGQRALFKKEVKNGTEKELKDASHYVFISNPDETEKLIREFLK